MDPVMLYCGCCRERMPTCVEKRAEALLIVCMHCGGNVRKTDFVEIHALGFRYEDIIRNGQPLPDEPDQRDLFGYQAKVAFHELRKKPLPKWLKRKIIENAEKKRKKQQDKQLELF